MRQLPIEHRERQPLCYFPEQPESFVADYLEIGPGNGEFLINLAKTYPEKKTIALELDRTRFNKISKRLTKREIQNVQLIFGDARVIIPRHLSECRFQRIYVLFPDPWPKRRHAPHRLMTVEFITTLSTLLSDNGSLFFATDVRAYAETVAKNISQVSSLLIQGDPFTSAENIHDYEATFFDRIARRDGFDINYLVANKVSK